MSMQQRGFALLICVVVAGVLAMSLIGCLQAMQHTQEIFAMTAIKHINQQEFLRAARQGKLKPLARQCVEVAECRGSASQQCLIVRDVYQAQSHHGLRLLLGFEIGSLQNIDVSCASDHRNKPFATKRLIYQKWL